MVWPIWRLSYCRSLQYDDSALRAQGSLSSSQTQCNDPYACHVTLPLIETNVSSDADSSNINIYNAREDSAPLHTLDKMHSRPVHIMTYNPVYNCVVSVDNGGMIEYWEPSGDFQKPMDIFEFKSKTDLYDFKKVPFQTKSVLTSGEIRSFSINILSRRR